MFTSQIDNCCFWCISDMASFAYIVELVSDDRFEEAIQIAERELGYWCDPESSTNASYYEGIGYVEVVENALEGAGISANYYTNNKEDD